jgi:hypothetical protein
VENHLHDAFQAVDDGTVFNEPRHVQALKDCIALHWARSKAYKQTHEVIMAAATVRGKRRWREQHESLLVAAFYDKYGFYPAGAGTLDHINDLLHEPPQMVVDGSLFAGRVSAHFERSRTFFRAQELEIGEVSGPGQLLIGDSPVLSFAREAGPWPVFRGPLFNSSTVVLLIGPRHLISLGREQKWISLLPAVVDNFNHFQVLAAERWVMYHPSGQLKGFVDGVLSEVQTLIAG